MFYNDINMDIPIKKARYGACGKFNNVTNIINKLGNEFTVSNSNFGDPFKGSVKQLTIEYENGFIRTYNENDKVLLNIDQSLQENKNYGFIILRHVSKKEHDRLWITCYNSIRNYYDNKIVIIDDNSDYKLVSQIELHNVIVIKSDFKGRGELLPYYYFYKLKLFDKAVILHDSMFINTKINFGLIDNIKFLWHFRKWTDLNPIKTVTLLLRLNDNGNLLKLFADKAKWLGCFGGACVITHDAVSKLQNNHNLFNLLAYVQNRDDRMGFERIIALLSFYNNLIDRNDASLLGDIQNHYKTFKYTFEDYLVDKCDEPIIKVWTGR